MSTTWVHFDKTTGEISNWGDGEIASAFRDNHAIAKLENVHMHDIHPSTHRMQFDDFDVKLIVKSKDEIAAFNMPTIGEVHRAIKNELNETIDYVAHDQPDKTRLEWTVYRQTLRKIIAGSNVKAMVAAWPIRPDGATAHAALLDRLADIEAGGKTA